MNENKEKQNNKNKGENIQKAFLDAINVIVDKKIKKIKFNYYVDGVIQKVNTDNTYDVLINTIVYKNILSKNGSHYKINDAVQILVKNGDWNKKVIDDLIKPISIFNDKVDYIIKQGNEQIIPQDVNNVNMDGLIDLYYDVWKSGKVEYYGIAKVRGQAFIFNNIPCLTFKIKYPKNIGEFVYPPVVTATSGTNGMYYQKIILSNIRNENAEITKECFVTLYNIRDFNQYYMYIPIRIIGKINIKA